jgi:nucleotide-binding universal stress UspA family protein
MSDLILVPIDGSDPANAALEFAIDEFPDAHLILYHSINPLTVARDADSTAIRPEFWSEQIEEAKDDAEELLAAAEERVGETAAEIELDAEVGPPTENVVRYIDRRDVDQVVMGSHGRTGLTRVALGSVAERVVRRSPVPVTVVHGDESS